MFFLFAIGVCSVLGITANFAKERLIKRPQNSPRDEFFGIFWILRIISSDGMKFIRFYISFIKIILH